MKNQFTYTDYYLSTEQKRTGDILQSISGLVLVRTKDGNRKTEYAIFHINTGRAVLSNTYLYGKRLKDFKAALAHISGFNWNEWKEREDKPQWADDAFRAVSQAKTITA